MEVKVEPQINKVVPEAPKRQLSEASKLQKRRNMLNNAAEKLMFQSKRSK
jgi:hypothetical protein